MFVRMIVLIGVAVFVWSAFVRPAGSHGPKREYVVKPYDSLWSIASANYAGDVRDGIYRIEQLNHLSGAPLMPGQTLVLP